MNKNKIQLFEDRRIRMAWDEEKEEWLLSIVDVVGVLTEQPTQRFTVCPMNGGAESFCGAKKLLQC